MRVRTVVVGMVAALVLASCSSGSGGGGGETGMTTSTVPAGSASSSPFSVTVPPAYELLAAGTGSARQGWGEDCCGSDEPYTMLERTDGEGEAVRVSIAGYEDMQGGFSQLSNGYGNDPVDSEAAEVDGKPGIWSGPYPGGDEGSRWNWPELIVDEGDDLAVTISGAGLTKDEAEDVYDQVELDGTRSNPPAVSSPPDGFEVVGAVDADGVLSLREARVDESSQPGSRRAHSAVWEGDRQSLIVQTVPGRAISREAAALGERNGSDVGEVRTVDGEPVLVIDSGPGFDARRIIVGIEAPWGDVVLVTAFTDQARSKQPAELPTVEELIAIARSVQQADEAEWASFVASVPG